MRLLQYFSLLPSLASAWISMSTRISGPNIVVVGGTGFVGSRVCKLLVEKGAVVTSISKTGVVPKSCIEEDWTKNVNWVAADLLNQDSSLDTSIGSPDAMISCVGVIGTDDETLLDGNGVANVNAFKSAKKGGKISNVALVSVSEEVVSCQDNWLPDFFSSYFKGKSMAEKAAMDAVENDPSKYLIVKPTFIYGGESFNFLPPRVTYKYGSAVEELLSFGLFQALANVTPGLIKVALRPPNSVDAVAAACVAAVMGELQVGGVLDGAKEINSSTNQPEAKGLTEALQWAKDKSIDIYNWAREEFPKAIESVKTKVNDLQNE